MIIHSFDGKTPQIGEGTFVAETAAITGDVEIGRDCSVWYSAVIRADGNPVRIGDRVSVQDCACIHISTGEGGGATIGSDVIIGHNATVHACTVGDRCLIGMGSTILDGAVIGEGAIVAAGAMVLGRTQVGAYEMWAGVPAKMVKQLDPASNPATVGKGVEEYVSLAGKYLQTLDENL